MNIIETPLLAEHTTFKIGGPADFFCRVTNEQELVEAVSFAREKNIPIFILGGGSNLLIGDRGIRGLVIKMEMRGITQAPEKDGVVMVTAAAGEMWDDFVEHMVSQKLYGIENLSAIPGTVGAAPIQNIGAYGMEVSDTITSVRVFDTETLSFTELNNAQCAFAYRDSMFKHQKNKYIVTAVSFALKSQGKINIEYRDLAEYFKNWVSSNAGQNGEPSIADVRKAVIDIRWNKLPDWKLWGTAGSFFKNPLIPKKQFDELKLKYPELPGFDEPDGKIKVSLGWILDKICNMKGLCIGNVCTYEKQALVLVAKPGATADEVVSFAQELMKQVKEKTGIEIEGEVEWVN